MLVKNHLSKIVILCVAGMAFLTQPVQSYESGLEFGLPAVGTVTVRTNATRLWITRLQQDILETINFNYPSKKDVEVSPPDGATIMISSVPVIIQNQVSKNIFTANIPNDRGGYSTVMLQKSGNRFIELPGEFLPDFY
jgi:hypothetical protein